PRDVAAAARVLGRAPERVQQLGAAPAAGPRHARGAVKETAVVRGAHDLGGNSIVFARRAGKILPVPIETGLASQDYIEVTSGLTAQDTVLVLVGASRT
ncbi:MAG TPA: hypothetical protein VEU74_13270, partial [Gemmatimonadales bacterium]|nr:hypothetical protein [Gemmatimonadales bacterium]